MALISVVVCTHNPKPDCLRRTLGSLIRQTLRRADWELLIVDNASDNRVSDTCDLSWHPRGRHLREERLGLTTARMRGIAEAKGDLLVFVDDDNELAPRFLEEARQICDRYPYLGAFGAGSLEPEFEIEPPPEICQRLDLLALRSVAEARWSNNVREAGSIPWGAGLCVRRQVADAYVQLVQGLGSAVIAVLGRRGQELFSGEDDVFSWVAASVGCGFGIFPQLRLTHVISAARLSRAYFLKLIQGHTFSHAVRQYMLAGTTPGRTDTFKRVHLLLHGLRNGWFSLQCQWAEARGEDTAALYIAENRLHPVELRDFVDVHLVKSRLDAPAELMYS